MARGGKDKRRRRFNKSGAPKLNDAQKAEKKAERGTANPRVVARQDTFRMFKGAKSEGFEMTCAGRLMLVGAFDGLAADPEPVLAALLDYSRAYWGNFGGGPQVAENGKMKVDGSPPEVCGEIDPKTGKLKDGPGEWFKARDDDLRSAGHQARMAVHSITVDQHWFPDHDSDWAERIINERIVEKRAEMIRQGRPAPMIVVAGQIKPNESDWAMLDLARRGAMALIGTMEKKIAA